MSSSILAAIGFVGIFLFSLFSGKLFIPFTCFSVIFQSLQLVNKITTQNDIYLDQIKAALTEPLVAFSVANGEVLPLSYFYMTSYLIVGIWLTFNVKTIKINGNTALLFLFSIALTATYLCLPQNYTDRHPTLYLKQVITNADDVQAVKEGDRLPLVSFQKDLAPRIILVIGESQGSLDNETVKTVMPRLSNRINSNQDVLLEDISQLGSFTAIATLQIIESMPLNKVSEKHYSILDIAEKNNKHGSYISSRNTDWASFDKRIKRSDIELRDCKDINPECNLLGGVDDLKILNEIIIPRLSYDRFFIVWQMNGSHTPIEDKSPIEFKTTTNEYHNSLGYTDYVINELIRKLPENTWLFFMSDHEKNHNGETGKILSFIHHNSDDLSILESNKRKPLTQLDILKTVFELQGIEANKTNNYNLLTEHVPKVRKRITFKIKNPSDPSIIK